MTPNVEDLVDSLKKLNDQIDQLESKTRHLAADSHELCKTIKLTKEFSHELSLLNNLSESQPRASLIHALQDERKQARTLEKENRDLRTAISQHKDVLEIVMFKYREQSLKLSKINRLESIYRMPNDDFDFQRHKYLQDKVNEMTEVINGACEIDDNEIQKQQRLISKLRQENCKIKKILLTK